MFVRVLVLVALVIMVVMIYGDIIEMLAGEDAMKIGIGATCL